MKVNDTIHAYLWQSMTVNNCNTYLIEGPRPTLIDPGHADLFDHVESELKQLDLSFSDIGLIICTHAHPDHIEAVRFFKDLPAKVAFHEAEWLLMQEMKQHVQGVDLDAFMPDFFLQDGDLNVNGVAMSVIHTPGHSPGSISLYLPQTNSLFTGDVIFKGALGRTDLPGGNGALLKESIRKLAELDAEYLFSGHGDIVTGSEAVKNNFEIVIGEWFAYI
jgi:glyoxylase-like metal-dependent hydrolase (beta-lactamase superfamily II)